MRKSILVFLALLIFISVNSIFYTCNADEYDDCEYEEECENEVWDPLEPMNQGTFRFNDFVYNKIMNPVSDAYVFITPSQIRAGISNFMRNLVAPKRFVGAAIQLKHQVAMTELGKFVINSTFGICGIFEVAKIKMEDEEDIGQGLAYWGIPNGPYIIWPFIGPSNFRDSLGMVGEFYLYPASYAGNSIQIATRSSDTVNEWPIIFDGYNAVTEGAMDPYTALKDAYDQYRNKKIRN